MFEYLIGVALLWIAYLLAWLFSLD